MGYLLPAINLGLGLWDYGQNRNQELEQESRRNDALRYLDTWESGYSAPDPFAGDYNPQAAMDRALGADFTLRGAADNFLTDLGFDPGGGWQQVAGAGISQLFDPTEIDRMIGGFQEEYRGILGGLQGRQFELGSTLDLLEMGDPLERERAAVAAGQESAGKSQEAMVDAYNQMVASSGDFDPFSSGSRRSFQDMASQRLYSDLDAARNAGLSARFGTEDVNAGIRQEALAEEMSYLSRIDEAINQLTGTGGLAGVISGLGVSREELLAGGKSAEQERLDNAMAFWGNSLLNADAVAQNQLAAGTDLYRAVAEAGLGQAGLNMESDLALLNARLGVLAPEYGTDVFQSIADTFAAATHPEGYVQSGSATPTYQYV